MALTTVTDYLEQTAARFPEKAAFVDAKRTMTFRELRTEARQVASELLRMDVHHQPVAIFLEKSAACIAAFLGALYSGNFYTPLDTSMPETRIRKILATLQPSVFITDEAHCAEALAFADGVRVMTYEEATDKEADDEEVDAVAAQVIDTDVCYVLFTSGSTGVPKGVIVPQRSVLDYVRWFADTFHIIEYDVFGNQAPLYFDLSIQDVYLPILTGCTTHLLPQEAFAFPTALMKTLAEKNVNNIMWSPSALCVVANMKGLRAKKRPDLRLVAFCGEVMPVKQLNQWRDVYPRTKFVNLYGPTEACDACTYYVIERNFALEESLPIGEPCHNTEILLLSDDDEKISPDDMNQSGELCIRGTSLAYGYYADSEKTRAAFVQNPLNTAYPEIIYRTGDLVHYNERGELMYDGRKDFQIKHMGYRIELGEIETATGSLAGVDANACVYDTTRDRIHLFYTGKAEEAALKDGLAKLVPHYMIPNVVHHLPVMPLNLNGKIDRTSLKAQVKDV